MYYCFFISSFRVEVFSDQLYCCNAYWNASSDDSVCIDNYAILIKSRAEQVIYNTTTDPVTTSLKVAGLTRGVEYTVIVTTHSSQGIKASKVIRMTLDGMKQWS